MYPRYADRALAHGYARPVQLGHCGGGQQYLSPLRNVFAELACQVHLVAEYVLIADIEDFSIPYAERDVKLPVRGQNHIHGVEASDYFLAGLHRVRDRVEQAEQVVGVSLDHRSTALFDTWPANQLHLMDHQQEGDYPVLLRGSGKAAHIKRQHGLKLAESVFYVLRYIRAPLGEADHVVEQLSQSLAGIHPLRRFFVVEGCIVHCLVPLPMANSIRCSHRSRGKFFRPLSPRRRITFTVRKSENALNLLHRISDSNYARLRNLGVDPAQLKLSSDRRVD